MTFQIFGLYRSGTNYLAWLVENNFDATVLHGTEGKNWKHGDPVKTGADGYLLIVKDPFAWVASRQRYRREDVVSLVNEWNRMGWKYLNLKESHVLIRYEDLLANLSGELNRIGQAYRMERQSVKDQPNALGRGDDSGLIVTPVKFDRSYYLEKRYLNEVDTEEITRRVDAELCERLGYSLRVAA